MNKELNDFQNDSIHKNGTHCYIPRIQIEIWLDQFSWTTKLAHFYAHEIVNLYIRTFEEFLRVWPFFAHAYPIHGGKDGLTRHNLIHEPALCGFIFSVVALKFTENRWFQSLMTESWHFECVWEEAEIIKDSSRFLHALEGDLCFQIAITRTRVKQVRTSPVSCWIVDPLSLPQGMFHSSKVVWWGANGLIDRICWWSSLALSQRKPEMIEDKGALPCERFPNFRSNKLSSCSCKRTEYYDCFYLSNETVTIKTDLCTFWQSAIL